MRLYSKFTEEEQAAVEAIIAERDALREQVATLQDELADFVAEAVQQDCWTHQPGEPRLFSHSFMATHKGWIDFLVQRGRMRRLDDERELYVFVEEADKAE